MIMKEMNLTESEIQGYKMAIEVLTNSLNDVDKKYRIKCKPFKVKGEPVDDEDQIYWNSLKSEKTRNMLNSLYKFQIQSCVM